MKSTFSRNMSATRKEYSLTQNDAAKKIGITRSRLGSYEEGRAFPNVDVLVKIAEAYKIKDVIYFISGKAIDGLNNNGQLITKYNTLTGKEKKAVDILLGID